MPSLCRDVRSLFNCSSLSIPSQEDQLEQNSRKPISNTGTKITASKQKLVITLKLAYILIRNEEDDDDDSNDAFRMECTMRSELCFESMEKDVTVGDVRGSSAIERNGILSSHRSCAVVLENMNCEQKRDMSVSIVNSKTNKTVTSLTFSSPRTRDFKLKRRSRNMLSPRRRRRTHMLRHRGHEVVGDICTCSVPGLCVVS